MVNFLLGDRIKAAAKAVGGQTKLADDFPMSRTTMAAYISGKNSPQLDVIERIAFLTGVSTRWLIFGDDHIPSEQIAGGIGEEAPAHVSAPSQTRIQASFYEVRPSAGNGRAVLSQTVEDYFSLPRDWLARLVPPTTPIGIMQAIGDSMEPGIRDGDLMIVRFDIDRIRDDGVYVISYDGDIRVKRLTVNVGEVVLSSDNPRYQEQRIKRAEADERLIVHGQVFWSGGAIRAGR